MLLCKSSPGILLVFTEEKRLSVVLFLKIPSHFSHPGNTSIFFKASLDLCVEVVDCHLGLSVVLE